MAVRTVDPDARAEGERETLQEQAKKFIALLGERSAEGGEISSLWETVIESSLSSEEGERVSSAEKGRRLLFQRFSELLEEREGGPRLMMRIGEEEMEIPLSRRFAALMLEILTEVAQGHSVSIGTGEDELTTSEAAELLNVSRPHLVKLLEEGKIPFHKVGTHRRVYRRDVLDYKARQRGEAEKAMQNLTDQAQELGLGY